MALDSNSALESQAEAILANGLPASATVGARRAWDAFVAQYGDEDGRRIFVKKALEVGVGRTAIQKVNSVFKKGANVSSKRKMLDTRVRVRGASPSVNVKKHEGR